MADSRRSSVGRFIAEPVRSDRNISVMGPRGNLGTMLINPDPLPGEVEVLPAESNLPSINRFLIWSGIAAGAVALVLTFFLSRRILAPVESLAGAARALAGGDFSRRVPVSSRDEVGELARTFNSMAEELARTEEIRRSLVADVAHELRTPLSNIGGYLEAMRDGLKADPATLDSMREEVVLLTRLIEDLQELALAESGQMALHLEGCDISDLARRSVTALQPQADARGVSLRVDAPDVAEVEGDPERLGQVLRNLLANAINYTPSGGRVGVAVATGYDGVHLSVEDTGVGIPKDELPHVFDRFYRVDKSRSRTTGGVGLGLTIARRLVEAHGGTITARSQPGQGTTFSVVLPRSDHGATQAGRPALTR